MVGPGFMIYYDCATVLPRNWIISIETNGWSCRLAGTVRVDLFVPVIALCDESGRSFHLNGNT